MNKNIDKVVLDKQTSKGMAENPTQVNIRFYAKNKLVGLLGTNTLFTDGIHGDCHLTYAEGNSIFYMVNKMMFDKEATKYIYNTKTHNWGRFAPRHNKTAEA